MKSTIKLDNVDPAAIAGVADSHLRFLEESFPCAIHLRGTILTLEGDEAAVRRVRDVVYEMMKTSARKNGLTLEDVRALSVLVPENGDLPRNGPEGAILFTRNGAVLPRTPGQKRFSELVKQNDIVFAIGPAGTGKTYLAVAFAVAAFKRKEVNRIILTRPAVEAGEKLGFLPGDLAEKINPYLAPLYDALRDLMPESTLATLSTKGTVEVIPLAYMRGRTLDSAFVILDEAQNCSAMQMKMFLTRLGPNSRAIVTGDVTQIDLPADAESGLLQARRLLQGIDGIGFAYFSEEDVVRHRLVKAIIRAYEGSPGRQGK